MGIDLQLCPVTYLDNHDGKPWGYSHTVLNMPRWGELFERIRELDTIAVTGRVSMYGGRVIPDGYMKGERTYGDLDLAKGDSYGDPWVYVRAGALAPVLLEFVPQERTDRRCGDGIDAADLKPAAAYIAAMPPSGLVILRWH